MDWITGMQKAIDYIEEHLTDEVDYESWQSRAFRQATIFSGYSVFYVGIHSANIFATAD